MARKEPSDQCRATNPAGPGEGAGVVVDTMRPGSCRRPVLRRAARGGAPAPGGGRAPDGSYFNTDSIDVALTERATARLRPGQRRRKP